MKRRLVLKDKKRFMIFIAFLIITIASCVFATNSYGYKPDKFKVITVRQGDTLWDIARQHSVNTDIRKYVYDIKKINSLEDNTIYAGNELKLPVK